MNKLRYMIFLLFILTLFSCSDENQIIDFEYYTEEMIKPLIKAEIGNIEYTFLFDTGSSKNRLYKSGVEKKFSNSEKFNRILEEKRKYNLDDTAYLITSINEIKINNNRYKKKEFILNSQINYLHDGIISYNFFNNLRSMIIDYQNKKIIINPKEHLESENILDFHIDSKGFILFPIYINDIKKEAILDTGMYSKELQSPDDSNKIANLKIGNILYTNIELISDKKICMY